MSMEVRQFLNDSGGNFTETAPRPPVFPGEENELHSNGGNSTRSSSSFKSHVSGKSHSSSKSAGSKGSDMSHSPAGTPRRSNLDKNVSTISLSDSKLVTDHDKFLAPLGFEPEGSAVGFEPESSAASSPPFHENSTPHTSSGPKVFSSSWTTEKASNSSNSSVTKKTAQTHWTFSLLAKG